MKGKPATEAAARRLLRSVPPWWPVVSPLGDVTRPAVLEVVAEPGSGQLTLALAWLAAATPVLAAFVDPHGACYPPAAVQAGVALDRLLLVRPPPDDPRAPLDAVVLLLRSEAFDVIVCPLPAGARISLGFAGKLATLAARSGTSLLLLTHPQPATTRRSAPPPKQFAAPFTALRGGLGAPLASFEGRFLNNEASAGLVPVAGAFMPRSQASTAYGLLGAFADFRIRLTGCRRLWEYGQLAGLRLRAATERARAAGSTGVAGDTPATEAHGGATYEITCRLHNPWDGSTGSRTALEVRFRTLPATGAAAAPAPPAERAAEALPG